MQPITLSIQLRFSDFDVFNHVNNVAFFEIMETARVEMLRASTPRSMRGQLVVRHAACDYEREIPGGTRSVDVTIGVEKIGTSSFTLFQEIRVEEAVVGIGRVVMVTVDGDGRVRPIDVEERAALLDGARPQSST